SVTVNAVPTPPAAPTAAVTVQPTCTVPTGTITITSSTAGLTFSIDGSAYATYPAGGYTVGSGPHTITAQNTSGCEASTSITVATAPGAPAAPVTQIVNPTCTVTTGTITITSPTAGLTFSFDNGTFGPYPAAGYTNIAPGLHTITVDNGSGCTTVVDVPVAEVPTAPAAPTASVTVQPTCTVPTGTIVVSAPTGAGFEYSIDGGAFQAAVTFTNVAPGDHAITVRNTADPTCISAPATVTVNAVPTPPAAPTASVTVQPTCTVPTGTVVVSVPTGAGFEYSIDGGAFQASATFTNVAPDDHAITVRNTADPT